jgi:hypothetical protein
VGRQRPSLSAALAVSARTQAVASCLPSPVVKYPTLIEDAVFARTLRNQMRVTDLAGKHRVPEAASRFDLRMISGDPSSPRSVTPALWLPDGPSGPGPWRRCRVGSLMR